MQELNQGLKKIYGEKLLDQQKQRYLKALEHFKKLYPKHSHFSFYSSPGRTEIGGNHTDHQHGMVLAGAVNLDIIAVVAPNHKNTICINSEGFNLKEIDLNNITLDQSEFETSEALIKGICSKFKELDYNIQGFDAYITSDVLKGSGLSSSAAFENLIGTILNYEFNNSKIPPTQIAQISQYAENVYFGKSCGLMDQMASALGGFSFMDFKNPQNPFVEKINFDFQKSNYFLCIVNTKGNHADLTSDYASITQEMQLVAKAFDKKVLREVDEKDFFDNIAKLREKIHDRALLRAIHFFKDNQNAFKEAEALKNNDFERFKNLVKNSGDSSFKFLQNIFSLSKPLEQNLALALALSERILKDKGVCRVHGGGFAGTIQAFVPYELVKEYETNMKKVFGEDSCYMLNIRNAGAIKL
ncbi:galactokinase [Campylobacter estrildidarum]|uniref:Galactokinase n=1 Tax=Campylobacter estrildidarum TaxID=2510189 RepID=A0A4U7BHV2_9BACT|nr:galactokinase family protein [Campylobacter estrildidarum]TKX28466.1 galactokinase [Campylobacter estrildidarum]